MSSGNRVLLGIASFIVPLYLISILDIVDWSFIFSVVIYEFPLVLGITAAMLAVNSLAWLRWHILVTANGLRIMPKTSYTLAQYSGLFTFFLPGQLGADSAKIIALNLQGIDMLKSLGERNIGPISGTVIDRLLALSSQLTWSLIFGYLLLRPFFTQLLKGIDLGFVLNFALVLSALLLTAFFLYKITKNLNNRMNFRGVLAYCINLTKIIWDFCRGNKLLLLALMLGSLFLNIIVILLMYVIASNSVGNADFLSMALATTVSNLATVIPITPGGLGISETIFSIMNSTLSNDSEIQNLGSIYMLYRFCSIGAFAGGTLLGIFIERGH